MVRWLMLGLLSACSFSALPGELGEGERLETIVHDTAADFGAGAVVDGVISPHGWIEPAAFVLGGLHARAFAGDLVDDADSYDQVVTETMAATPRGAGYRQVLVDWGSERPRGLGLTSNDSFTLLYDGEILLPAGTLDLEVTASERAIVQVALDPALPGAFGERLFAHNAAARIAITVPAAGWYPIRIAYSEGGSVARLLLALVDGPVTTPVGPERLRARITEAPGLVVFGFDGQGFVTARGETARPTIDDAFGVLAPPFDLGQAIDRFSLRYAGQLRIDTPGAYTFTADLGLDTNDGWRLWIDRAVVARRWGEDPEIASVTLDLAPGWHDLLVDYADTIGNAEIEVRMMGPDAPEGGPIDPARLRPAVRFGNTFTFFEPAPTTIRDLQATTVQLPLPGSPLTLIDSVDYGFELRGQDMPGLTVELDDCGPPKQLQLHDTANYHYYGADKASAGKLTMPVPPWTFRVTDAVAGNGAFPVPGEILNYGVTALYRGGERMPFAPVILYESAALPTPDPVRLAAVRFTGDFDGANVELSVRTGPDAATLAAAPWVVVADGAVPDVEASALVQYRAVITTDGWQFPALDRVEIGYVVAAPPD